jgi:hypothetical protein
MTALLTVAFGGAMAQSASAKKVKITMKGVVNQKGTAVTGTIKGTLGTCKSKGKLVLPLYTGTWKCKGGTIKLRVPDSGIKGAKVGGTIQFTGGTGKFKKIKGKGKVTGPLANGNRTYTGTITY